jgi:tetratricopeptide (TPR) repeat protein
MIRKRLPTLSRTLIVAGTALSALVLSLPSAAQRAQGEAQPQTQTQTKVVPALRFQIGEQFTRAQTCLDEEDVACALKTLDDVAKIRDLNTYESAQLWNFRAFIYFDQDNVDGAIEAYEKIMELPQLELPDGLIQSSMRNLATLYLQQERYQQGLDTYIKWMALPFVTPSSDDHYLLATIYYQMEKYADGVPSLLQAIQLAKDKGDIGDENWYQLLYVLYYQLEQTDKVIETLTIMVENWTKREHVLALAGQLSAQDREGDTLTLYEAAYEAGWLTRGTEWVQLANLYLNARTPFKAAKVLNKGLTDGVIESTQANWRLLAQAWQMASEHEKALPALSRASTLAEDGEIDRLLAQSLARLARWDECVDAARKSIDRGGLDRADLVNLQLGQCLVNLRKYSEARQAFQAASQDERSRRDGARWLSYVDTEARREQANQEALASLARNRN